MPLAVLARRHARGRARRYAVRFPAAATLAAVAPRGSRLRRHLPLALFAAALAALAIAVARPQATVAVPVEQASVVLVTDASRSMSATDVDPSRLDAAREAGRSFLDEVPDELRVGAVVYSQVPHTVHPPSEDRDGIHAILDGLVADGGTATGDALAAALELLREDGEREHPPAAIVLLSDGKSTDGRDPVEVAREARSLGVPIYTVALGTSSGWVPGDGLGGRLPVPPDPATLREVAGRSGGQAFTAGDAGELGTVYERLGSRIGTRAEKREITAGFAGGGIVLLLAGITLSLRWFGRLP